jgi:1-acyl-sn-glycerol-3-phosphate acyltransferase
VQFRGPSATSGYFNAPEATAALIQDGWHETGDRAYLAGGELFVTGRNKDIVIRAGRNLHPTELEEAIGALDGVRSGHVAVFGSADATSGTEKLVVLAETRRRDAASRIRLTAAINTLAIDLVAAPPDDIVLAAPNTVLRTSSGKIRRSACRALYESGQLEATARAPWVQVLRFAPGALRPQWRRALARAQAQIHALWAWCVLTGLGVVAWSLTWLPLPAQALWVCVRGLARLLTALTATPIARVDVDRLPAAPQPCIVVANHQSYLDGIVLYAALPRRMRFLVKAELGRSPLLARPLARLGALFVERFDARAGLATLGEAGTALAAGDALLIFPEGTFKRMPGVLPFHLGAFSLAVAYQVPVLPLAIRGTRSLLRAGSWFPRRGPIVVTLGVPLSPTAQDDPWQTTLTLRDEARRFLVAAADEPDLGHASNRVDD